MNFQQNEGGLFIDSAFDKLSNAFSGMANVPANLKSAGPPTPSPYSYRNEPGWQAGGSPDGKDIS